MSKRLDDLSSDQLFAIRESALRDALQMAWNGEMDPDEILDWLREGKRLDDLAG